jgi:preprotein translocase subunit SecD
MKSVSDLLREADPLNDDTQGLEDARDRIRRRVVAAALVAQSRSGNRVSRRRALGTFATLAVALVVVGVVLGIDKGNVQAAVRFEVRLAETEPAPGLVVARLADSGQIIYLHQELIVTNDDIAQSWVRQDSPDRFGVSVELLEAGAERMRQATGAHLGRPVAILIDGHVVTAPVVRSEISNSAVIDGNYTNAEAERIVAGISMR